MQKRPKVLINRTDALGDLILSLPAAYWYWKKTNVDISFLVSKKNFFLLEFLQKINLFPFSYFLEEEVLLENSFYWENVEEYVFLGGNTSWNWKALRKGIERRKGIYSRLSSFFTLNRGQRQKRSIWPFFSEMEWNRRIFFEEKKENSKDFFLMVEDFYKDLQIKLEKHNFCPLEKKYTVIVHPGMRNTGTFNLSTKEYSFLLKELLRSGHYIGITATDLDLPFIEKIFEFLTKVERDSLDILNGSSLSFEKIISYLREASFVVAPSTGILHLASMLGTPVVSYYSSLATQNVERWGPIGYFLKTQNKAHIFKVEKDENQEILSFVIKKIKEVKL